MKWLSVSNKESSRHSQNNQHTCITNDLKWTSEGCEHIQSHEKFKIC